MFSGRAGFVLYVARSERSAMAPGVYKLRQSVAAIIVVHQLFVCTHGG